MATLNVDLAKLSAGIPQGLCEAVPTVITVRNDNCTDVNAAPTVGSPIDLNNLSSGGREVVTLVITNNTPTAQTVILGTELGIAGNFSRYGRTPSACDSPGVVDQNGANIQKTQGVAALWSNHSALSQRIDVFTANAAQRAVPLNRIQFDANGDSMNRTGRIPSSNTEDNFVRYSGLIAFSDRIGASYSVLTLQTVTIEIEIFANASIENFASA